MYISQIFIFRKQILISLLGLFFLVSPYYGYNQENKTLVHSDSLAQTKKNTTTKPQDNNLKKSEHSPKLATWMSVAVPGLGQVYNKKYWKTPVIYAGFAVLIYETVYLNKKYEFYGDLYDQAIVAESNSEVFEYNGKKYKSSNLQYGRDYYRKYRDLTIIGMSLWYVLNIIDANVDAHFFDYDISDDLTLHVQPEYNYTALAQTQTMGLRLSLKF